MFRAEPSPRFLPTPSDPPAHRAGEPRPVTLLELVRAIGEVTSDDREVVATVVHMLRSGRVRLIGNFRGTRVEEFS